MIFDGCILVYSLSFLWLSQSYFYRVNSIFLFFSKWEGGGGLRACPTGPLFLRCISATLTFPTFNSQPFHSFRTQNKTKNPVSNAFRSMALISGLLTSSWTIPLFFLLDIIPPPIISNILLSTRRDHHIITRRQQLLDKIDTLLSTYHSYSTFSINCGALGEKLFQTFCDLREGCQNSDSRFHVWIWHIPFAFTYVTAN